MLRQQQIGIVILTTIIMLSILTLLVLSLMQTVLLYIKVSNQVLIRHERFYKLEAAAHQLLLKNHQADCVIHYENPNKIMGLSVDGQGCLFVQEKQQYQYLVDDLGLFPCLKMAYGKERQSSHHWVITILSPLPEQAMLQLRIAKPAKAVACGFSDERWINSGIISWRYLPHIARK